MFRSFDSSVEVVGRLNFSQRCIMNLSNVCVRFNILFLRCRVALNPKSIDLDGLCPSVSMTRSSTVKAVKKSISMFSHKGCRKRGHKNIRKGDTGGGY